MHIIIIQVVVTLVTLYLKKTYFTQSASDEQEPNKERRDKRRDCSRNRRAITATHEGNGTAVEILERATRRVGDTMRTRRLGAVFVAIIENQITHCIPLCRGNGHAFVGHVPPNILGARRRRETSIVMPKCSRFLHELVNTKRGEAARQAILQFPTSAAGHAGVTRENTVLKGLPAVQERLKGVVVITNLEPHGQNSLRVGNTRLFLGSCSRLELVDAVQFKNGIISFEAMFRARVYMKLRNLERSGNLRYCKARRLAGSVFRVFSFDGMVVDKVVEAARIASAALYCQERGVHHASDFYLKGTWKLVGSYVFTSNV
jgi:hypothetical protein